MATCAWNSAANTWKASYNPLPTLDGSCVSGSDSVVVTIPEYKEYLLIKQGTVSGITSEDALLSFSWGFGAIMFFWLLGWSVEVAINAIRRI